MATCREGRYSAFAVAVFVWVGSAVLSGAVPQGSATAAERYYRTLAKTLGFRTSTSIVRSTLDDVFVYVGYAGLTARDAQRLAPDVLMDPAQLGKPCQPSSPPQPCPTSVSRPTTFARNVARAPLQPGDILSSRFFAPKIIDVSKPAESRQLGWRKFVRLRSRPGSAALRHGIEAAVVLFNFFTEPGEAPFGPTAESVNTQVMLLTSAAEFSKGEMDSLYWLDYDRLAKGGRLSLKLDASFDATDLQANAGVKPYFVPDGCVACHGENPRRPLVNYLDTDHWFDRIENDFVQVKQANFPVLADAGTNELAAPGFAKAFDVIRRFNVEAEAQAAMAQPTAFHRAATKTWLRLHDRSVEHFTPVDRSVESEDTWKLQDKELLERLNRYCFRCHGTIKFNVFDKAAVRANSGFIQERLKPVPAQIEADSNFRMPPDRTLSAAEIDRLWELVGQLVVGR
jgi:hypothetical protein